MTQQLTAIIQREGDGYVALCPELDIASQGDTVSEARSNLKEALELFFETAPRRRDPTAAHQRNIPDPSGSQTCLDFGPCPVLRPARY